MLGVSPAAPIEPCQFERKRNPVVRRVPVLRMKEIQAVAENARLMIKLDPQSLPRVRPAETPFEREKTLVLFQLDGLRLSQFFSGRPSA